MKTIDYWSDVVLSSVNTLGQSFMEAVPNILGAVFLVIIGWMLAKLFSFLVGKLLKALNFNKLMDRLSELPFIKNSEFTINGVGIVKKFVYWIILLLFFISASETLGWSSVSQEIGKVITYLPKLFSALIILVIGLYIANLVRGVVSTTLGSLEISSSKLIASVAFYAIVIVISITALNQAGIDTEVITSNLIVITGAIMLAFTIAFGLGSREILSNILSATYSKKNFDIGDHINVGNIQGEITKMDNISVTLKKEDIEHIIPARRLITENVQKLLAKNDQQ